MKTSNPYSNTKKRKAALKWMATRGITQVRALYPAPPSDHAMVVPNARLTFASLRAVRAS